MWVIESLAAWTGFSRNSTKHDGDLNLPQVDGNGSVDGIRGNRRLLINWYGKTDTRSLSVARPEGMRCCMFENPIVSCSIVQGIRDHCGVLLEVEWGDICRAPQVERLVPVCPKTDVLDLQLRDKLARWARNGSWVEEIRKNFERNSLPEYRTFSSTQNSEKIRILNTTTGRWNGWGIG